MEPLFQCPVCHERFDHLDRAPRSLIVCGHLVCSCCLARILNIQNRQLRCPLDNTEIPKTLTNVEQFPVCIPVKQYCEQRAKEETCPKHNEKISFICLNDKEKICDKCVGSHLNKHHEIMESELKEKIDKTRQKIKQFIEKNKDIEKTIDEKSQQYTNEIHKKFSEFKSLVDKREEETRSKVSCYFESQKVKIKNLFGGDSKLLRDLMEKESKSEGIFHYQDLTDSGVFGDIDKQIDECELKISSEGIDNKFWSKLEQNNQDFCDKFALGKTEFLSKTEANGLWTDESLNVLKIKSFLNIEFVDNCLTIITANEQKEALIELDKWNQANQVELILGRGLSKEDESLLDHIWQKFKTVNSLYFKFLSGAVSKSLSEIVSIGMSALSISI